MAQVLVRISPHPQSHLCVRLDCLFSSCSSPFFPSVCFSYLFFFYLNLDLYLFLHVDIIGAYRMSESEYFHYRQNWCRQRKEITSPLSSQRFPEGLEQKPKHTPLLPNLSCSLLLGFSASFLHFRVLAFRSSSQPAAEKCFLMHGLVFSN